MTRDPFRVARGGGFDRAVSESAQNWLLFHTIFTLIDCLAGSTLYSSATLRGEHRGTTPRGAPPQKFMILDASCRGGDFWYGILNGQ